MLSWTGRRRGWLAPVPPISVSAAGGPAPWRRSRRGASGGGSAADRRPGARGAARRVRAALGALVVAAAAVCACSPGPGGPRGAGTGAPTGWDTDTGPLLRSRAPDPRTLSVGVTHTRFSMDPGVPPAAAARAQRVLAATASYQNQHVMGWGALNPEPSPGRYDWSSLDHRLDLIRRSGGTPVVTLCCAPDWMKGGRAGRTNWDRLDVRPDRAHVADFAALSAAVARRY